MTQAQTTSLNRHCFFKQLQLVWSSKSVKCLFTHYLFQVYSEQLMRSVCLPGPDLQGAACCFLRLVLVEWPSLSSPWPVDLLSCVSMGSAQLGSDRSASPDRCWPAAEHMQGSDSDALPWHAHNLQQILGAVYTTSSLLVWSWDPHFPMVMKPQQKLRNLNQANLFLKNGWHAHKYRPS